MTHPINPEKSFTLEMSNALALLKHVPPASFRLKSFCGTLNALLCFAVICFLCDQNKYKQMNIVAVHA